MMKMDGRDGAEYQIWEKKGQNGHFVVDLSHKKTKQGIVHHLPHFKKVKT